jgi:hypothetical protein
MQPTWILEADMFGAEAEALKTEIRRQGMRYHVLRRTMLGRNLPDFLPGWSLHERECVVGYGSLPFVRQILEQSSWSPGAWCDPARMSCTAYYPQFGSYLLNSQYVMLPGVEAIRTTSWLFDSLAVNGRLFARPSSCEKLFPGRTYTRAEFPSALASVRYRPDELVVLAQPRAVDREWRLVIAGNELVTGCQYAERGEPMISPTCPREVREWAARFLAETCWRPDDLFLMDVAESGGEIRVVELNPFSSSGLYACDLSLVVRAAAEFAMKAWERASQPLSLPELDEEPPLSIS